MGANKIETYGGAAEFTRDTTGLPVAAGTPAVRLADGDTWDLIAASVRKHIGENEVRMLAYNGSIPGPTLRVKQGSTVSVRFTNHGDHENTVHWHGLRLDNRFDGTHETQAPVQIGESFTYQVTFPDPGVYWYHPHIREDYGQELGLYGSVIVEPAEPGYWSPVNRDMTLTLDDILIEDGQIASFSPATTTYAAMGRFGNVMLVNGEPELALTAQCGEVVRYYLTNTANTRVFNVGFDGARMKLVGGDSGRVERETIVDHVRLAPSERVVVDVQFGEAGTVTLEHRTPNRRYHLAAITVTGEPATPSFTDEFITLRVDEDLVALRDQLGAWREAAPDKSLAFVAEMDMGEPEGEGPVVYTCPMHPEIVSNESGKCPICGMKLIPSHLVAQASHAHGLHDADAHHNMHGQRQAHEMPQDHEPHAGHAMPEHHGTVRHGDHHGMHAADMGDGIEWEDDMVAVNRMTTPANTRWMLVDRETGARNHAIDWRFRVGDRVKLRLVNEMESDHPMHHPFHIHGAGRFLILARDGVTEPNLVWKDTVLVRTGETVDILLDVTNPGLWMAHCHIAEHHESGMMLSFTVTA